jgi:predicted secreted protein
VAAEIADYQDSGLEVVGVIGIAGSPSCGVQTTLDLPAAMDVLSVVAGWPIWIAG